jgi:hypothetical protein
MDAQLSQCLKRPQLFSGKAAQCYLRRKTSKTTDPRCIAGGGPASIVLGSWEKVVLIAHDSRLETWQAIGAQQRSVVE